MQETKHRKADSGLPSSKAVAGTVKGAGQKKMQAKLEQRHRSMSVGSEEKEKKAEGHKSSGHRRVSKGDGKAVLKVTERTGDKGKGVGSVSKVEEVVPVVKPVKHKHRKSEEIIIDPTVTDLFKPDGVIPTELVKKEGETAESAAKEVKDPTLVSGGVKEAVHGSKSTTGEMSQGQGPSVEGPKSFGDAGPDKKGDRIHHVSLLTKQPVSVTPQLAKSAASSMEHKVVAEVKQLSQTAATSSSKESPEQLVCVSLKAEKGQVKIIHSKSKQLQQHKQSRENDGQNPAHLQRMELKSKEQKSSCFQEENEEKPFQLQQNDEPKSSHSQHKEEPKVTLSQQKEERKSLFEVLAKPQVMTKEHEKHSKAGVQDKKERKESTEKKHAKSHKEKKLSKDGKCLIFFTINHFDRSVFVLL